MRSNENYMPHAAVAAFLSVAILVLFQIYLLREPSRIAADEARTTAAAVTAGQTIFTKNCATCHGEKGEGSDDGPSLNNKQFLSTTDDGTIFSVASSGVPNTQMPAWSQAHGGPFTDEDLRQVVAFIRSWQPNAPDLSATTKPGSAVRGAVIFNSTCVVCHGQDGKGTSRAPALNDPAHLLQFDDAWYRDVIMKGRPAQGMPTWGTVLSPAQINDVLALLDSWRAAAPANAVTETVTSTTSVTTTTAITVTETPALTTTETTTATAETARPSNPGGAGPALALSGHLDAGASVYTSSCAKCHGEAGKGGVSNPGSTDGTIPALNPIDETIANKDPKVFAFNLDLFIEHGSKPDGTNPQQVMPAWGDEKKLTPQQIADVISYLMNLNGTPSASPLGEITATSEITATAEPTAEVARPSNPGGPGQAVSLKGNVTAGASIFAQQCSKCHGKEGVGGISNPGSSDGTIPPLNPIDDTLVSKDAKVFATNIDLFVEHGSTPEGDNPKEKMVAFGDEKKLTPQQIADVIAYVMSLNK